jgi:hypothetical protein
LMRRDIYRLFPKLIFLRFAHWYKKGFFLGNEETRNFPHNVSQTFWSCYVTRFR